MPKEEEEGMARTDGPKGTTFHAVSPAEAQVPLSRKGLALPPGRTRTSKFALHRAPPVTTGQYLGSAGKGGFRRPKAPGKWTPLGYFRCHANLPTVLRTSWPFSTSQSHNPTSETTWPTLTASTAASSASNLLASTTPAVSTRLINNL